MWEEYPIARKSVKVPAEALEWSLASEEVVNPVCPMMNIQLDRRSQELVDLSTMSHGSTPERVLPLKMVDKSTGPFQAHFRPFLVMSQSREAFSSRSKAASECFCEHLR